MSVYQRHLLLSLALGLGPSLGACVTGEDPFPYAADAGTTVPSGNAGSAGVKESGPTTDSCAGDGLAFCPADRSQPARCAPIDAPCETATACSAGIGSCGDAQQRFDCVTYECVPFSSCNVFAVSNDWTHCLQTRCCAAIRDCVGDAACVACIQDSSACGTSSPALEAYTHCLTTECDG